MDSRSGQQLSTRQCNAGVFIWNINNPLYFKIVRILETTGHNSARIISFQVRFNNNLRRQLNLHKCYLNFKIWTLLTPSSEGLRQRLQFNVLQFLNCMHVISVNNVLCAVQAFVQKYDKYIFHVTEDHDIKINY
jgi:hypothetical protein